MPCGSATLPVVLTSLRNPFDERDFDPMVSRTASVLKKRHITMLNESVSSSNGYAGVDYYAKTSCYFKTFLNF